MKKMFVIIAGTILLLSVLVTAGMLIPANDKAIEHSPMIGENGDLTRVDFIHYAKPVNPGKPGAPRTETCYKLLGVQWKSLPVNYAINPANSEGLSEAFVSGAISTAAESWDSATSAELSNNPDIDYNAQYGIQDYKNSIDFGGDLGSNIIAVTSIWYTRRGKQLVEFDIRFNSAFDWGNADSNPGLMDLQNIATHELGHGVGMGDVYSTSCSYVTMYGYSSYGETSKRSLEQPDITGLQKMYGA